SPEQAAAEKDVGPKADQYALACVLYEMLVGEPPFTGPTASAIAMRHISEEPRPMRLRRHSTPVGVDAAVMRAMEKVPADRFWQISTFVAALSQAATALPPPSPERKSERKKVAAALGMLLLVVGIAIVVARSGSGQSAIDTALRALSGTMLDSNRIVLFVSESSPKLSGESSVDQLLGNALTRWSGVTLPSPTELREAIQDRTHVTSSASRTAIARGLGAGKYILVDIASHDSILQVRAELYDVAGKRAPRIVTVAYQPHSKEGSSAFDHLAFMLLFGDAAARLEGASGGTNRPAAFSAFIRGKTLMDVWNLAEADSALSEAMREDPRFPHASLALSIVRSWERDDAPEISGLLTRALDGANRLSPSERLHALALRDMQLRRFPSACDSYRKLLDSDSADFAAWYGIAECNRRDNTVVASAGGRRLFRGNLQYATAAIERAFDLLPRLDACCLARVNEVLRQYYRFTSNSRIRYGKGVLPDTNTYGAYPELLNDTLAFNPHAVRSLSGNAPPASHDEAVHAQRRRFLSEAAQRVAFAPRSSDALELLGEALELAGDVAAIDTTRRARNLATDSSHSLRLAIHEVWLRVKFAMPGNLRELTATRIFAESLLARKTPRSIADAAALASLAAMVGDATKAASLAERSAGTADITDAISREVEGTAYSLLAYAVAGGPADSLRELQQRLRSAISNGVVVQRQAQVREMYLLRAAGLAYPAIGAAALRAIDTTADVLLLAEAAHARGDRAEVRRIIAGIDRTRTTMSAADVTLDALYPEAWLLAAVGDTVGAIRRIDATLDALRSVPASQFENVVKAGALMQCMLLRAELGRANGLGNGAVKWAAAVEALTDSRSPLGASRLRKLPAQSNIGGRLP
ncbi:MAG: protein kinase, partial [Gemmatimonadetes bacterium]|nr:protein kinase [Gemmatimonadota bacterium]